MHVEIRDANAAAFDRHQSVDAAKERRLSRAGRTDDASDTAFGDAEGHTLQHLHVAERLVHAIEDDDGLAVCFRHSGLTG